MQVLATSGEPVFAMTAVAQKTRVSTVQFEFWKIKGSINSYRWCLLWGIQGHTLVYFAGYMYQQYIYGVVPSPGENT